MQIFSPIPRVAFLLLLIVSFNTQKFYIFITFTISFFIAMSRKSLPNPKSQSFSPMSSSKSSIVLAVMVRFMIYYELIFTYGIWNGPTLFLCVDIQFYPPPFVGKTILSPLSKIVWPYSILASILSGWCTCLSLRPLVHISVFMPIGLHLTSEEVPYCFPQWLYQSAFPPTVH